MFDRVYNVKFVAEVGWAVLVAVITYVATTLAATDFETLDPTALGIALLTGSVRVAVAVLINTVRTLFTS